MTQDPPDRAAASPAHRAPLDVALMGGVAVVAITEGLSLFHAINRVTVCVAWIAVAGLALLCGVRPRWPRLKPDILVGTILVLTALTAILSPPNGWDAISYHMGRVMHWIQNGSVAHYPTHDLREVVFGPFAEFVVLQLQLIANGDRLVNLVEWGAFAGSLYAVAELTRRCGGNGTAVRAAVIFAATLPMAILQASGTENDLVVAFWLLLTILAVEENLRTGTFASALKVGAAAGLLALTKGTGYIVGAPVLFGWGGALALRAGGRGRAIGLVACAAAVAAVLNAGYYARNIGAFDAPLGDAQFVAQHQMEEHSVRALASTFARNVSFHLLTPFPDLNDKVVRSVETVHDQLGMKTDDARTTFLGIPFSPVFAVHEDQTGNPLHFLAILLLLVAIALRRVRPGRPALACVGVVAVGSILLSGLVRWQPWSSRFQTGLFIVMAVPCGIAAAQAWRPRVVRWVSAIFALACLPWLLANDTRPLLSLTAHQRARNVFTQPRVDRYFAGWPPSQVPADIGRRIGDWDPRVSYLGAVDALTRAGCTDVGLIDGVDSWRYPLWAVARAEGTTLRIRDIEVENATGRQSPESGAMCAVVRLESFFGFPIPSLDAALQGPEIFHREPITVTLTPPAPPRLP